MQSSKLVVASLSCAELGTAQPQLVLPFMVFEDGTMLNVHLICRTALTGALCIMHNMATFIPKALGGAKRNKDLLLLTCLL